jgi:predicted anti-sigma-YlaC factor YlaD
MLNLIPPTDCARAREAASARLDDELSELEVARLDDHLRGCADCRAFARGLHALSSGLRAATLEQPQIEVFAPARRRPLVRLRAATAAAAIVAVVTGSAFVVGRIAGVRGGPAATALTGTAADFLSVQADSNAQHMLAMVRDPKPSNSLRFGRSVAV